MADIMDMHIVINETHRGKRIYDPILLRESYREGGILPVQKDKVIRFQMLRMLGSSEPFSLYFRTDDGNLR